MKISYACHVASDTTDPCSPDETCEGDILCFKHKIRTLLMATGVARQPKTREFRHPEKGYRMKQTKDEATRRGNVITEHAVGDRQDVQIRPDKVNYRLEKS